MRATEQLECAAAWLVFGLSAALASGGCRKDAETREESGADAGVAAQPIGDSPGHDAPGYVMPPFEPMPVHQLREIEGEMPVTVIRKGVELMRGKKLGLVRVPTPPGRKWIARLGPGSPPDRPTLLDTMGRGRLAEVEEVMTSIPHHGFAVVIPEEGGRATKLRYDTGEMEEIRATCPADEHPKVRVFAPSDGDPVWLFAEAADGSFWHGPWKDLNDLAPRIEHAHVFRADRGRNSSYDDGLGGMVVESDILSVKDVNCARFHVRADGSFHCHHLNIPGLELADEWLLSSSPAAVAARGSNALLPLLENDAKQRDLVEEECEPVAVGAWAATPSVYSLCVDWSRERPSLALWWTPTERRYTTIVASGCGQMTRKPLKGPMLPLQCAPDAATLWVDIERGILLEHRPVDAPNMQRVTDADLSRLFIAPATDGPELYLLDFDRLEQRVIDARVPCRFWESGTQLGRRAAYSCYQGRAGAVRLAWSEIVDADLGRRFRVKVDVPLFDGPDRVVGVVPGRAENRVVRVDLNPSTAR